jgi:asparagine synthase (glutamine-hydrolysing)
MSGVYGGELLRKVIAFKPEPVRRELFSPELYGYVDQAKETYARNIQAHPVSFAVFKQAPWSQYGILALEETQVAVRCPFLDNDLVRTVFRAPAATLDSNEICMQLITDGNSDLLQIPTDRGLYGKGHALLEPISHGWFEFLFKAEYAYDMGMPQWLARVDHAFSRLHLERLFLGRHKVFHFRVWYRDALAGYLRDTLLDSTSLTRPYLERRVVEAILDGHLKGHRNYTHEIHKLLTLELLHRLFLDKTQGTVRKKASRALEVAIAGC